MFGPIRGFIARGICHSSAHTAFSTLRGPQRTRFAFTASRCLLWAAGAFCATAAAGGALLAADSPVSDSQSSLSDEPPQKPTTKTKTWYFYSGPHPEELSKVCIFSGSFQRELTKSICSHLGLPLSPCHASRFNDGECNIQIRTEVRGRSTFVVQSAGPSSDSIMELLLMCTALRRASAGTITTIIPYYGYGRSDGMSTSSLVKPFGAADICNLLQAAGVDRVVAVDMHAGQIQGFFPSQIPMDHLTSVPIAAAYFSEKQLENPVVIAPDPGVVKMGKDFMENLLIRGQSTATMAMVMKHLDEDTKEDLELIGEVSGRDIILVNDLIDTGRTYANVSRFLKKQGAKRIFGYSTHGLMRAGCVGTVEKSDLTELIITDSLSPNFEDSTKTHVLTLAPILAEVIYRISTKLTINDMFNVHRPSATAKNKTN